PVLPLTPNSSPPTGRGEFRELEPTTEARMPLQISFLGIDGSGKTTVASALPMILAAELGLTAASAGEGFRVCAPHHHHPAPRFAAGGPALAGGPSRPPPRPGQPVRHPPPHLPAVQAGPDGLSGRDGVTARPTLRRHVRGERRQHGPLDHRAGGQLPASRQ